MSTPHILSNFEAALKDLRGDLLMMARLAERNLLRALEGLFERNESACNVTIADDEEIDALEKSIDARGVEVLTRFQPVASDLRQIIAAMKLTTSIERIGDQAVNIARKARKLNARPGLPETALLRPLAEMAVSALKKSLNALTHGDAVIASGLKAEDAAIDAEQRRVNERILERMASGGEEVADYLNLIFISRHLERVADQATNIAEDVVFAECAEDIRHTHAAGGASAPMPG
jgi:phosphate transport system protein